MRKTMMAALAALALVAAPLAASAAEVKLGVVDLQKALNSTKEGIAVKEVLSGKLKARKEQLAPRERELKDIQEKLKSSVLSKEAKTALQKDGERKLSEFQELAYKAQNDQKKEEQEATQKILDGLIDIGRKIGKDEGFTLLLEKNGSGLVFYQDALDLTDRLVKAYDEKTPAGGEKKP
jgi:outer membrane protein